MTAPIKQAPGKLVEIDTRSKREIAADAKAAAAAERARAKAEREEQKRLQAELDARIAADRKAEERACKTEAELVAVGRARGYDHPEHWAARKWGFIRMGHASRAAAEMRRRHG
jgi:hypothetical protein